MMIKGMIGFSLVVYAIGIFLSAQFVPWTTGILLGLLISILKLKQMEKSLTIAVTLAEDKAKNYAQRHYMIRYLLTGVVLFVAALTPSISLVGVFFGLLSMKIGAYMELYKVKK